MVGGLGVLTYDALSIKTAHELILFPSIPRVIMRLSMSGLVLIPQ